MMAAVAVSRASRIKRLLLATGQYGGIVLGTLIVADVACNALGVFPPTYEYGDPTVGWVAAPPMGVIGEYGCTEYSSGVKYTYTRNEDGVRTRFSAHQLVTDSTSFAPIADTRWPRRCGTCTTAPGCCRAGF